MEKLFLKKRLLVFIPVFLFGLVGHGQQRGSVLQLTLRDAIGIALSENPTIKMADQDVELKKVSRKEAWQSLLPTVDLSGNISYTIEAATMNIDGNQFKMGRDKSNSWTGALQVSLPLFAPSVYRTMNMTREDIEKKKKKSRESRNSMVNQTTKAYFQLLLAQDSYDVLKKSYDFSVENYNVVKAKFEQGKVSEYDKISAEVQMRNMKPSVVSAENAVNLAMLQLKVLLGISDAELQIEIKDNLKNYEADVAAFDGQMLVSLKENSTLKQLDFNERLLHSSLKVQKASFMPTLALSYQYQYQSISNADFRLGNYNWSPSSTLALSLSVPLYRASNFTKVKSTRIQLEQLTENRINTERQLQMQATSYQDNMEASAEQLTSNKESVAQAEKGRLIAQKRYEIGKGTILELNSSEVALTQSQLTYNQSIYDYLVAKADLDYLMGKDYHE